MMQRQRRSARLLWLGLLLGSTGSTQAAAIDTQVTDPWAATGLDFSFIEKRLKTEACYRSETRFLSCMGAVQRLLERGKQRMQMRLPGDGRAETGVTIGAQFGSLLLVETQPLQRTTPVDFAEEVRASRTRLSDWRQLYRTSTEKDIDFSQLRKWLLAEVVEPKHRSSYAAAAINGYLSIEDAHAKIMPAKLVKGEPGGEAPGNAKAGSSRYSGIGVAVELIGNTPTVSRVLPGGPADKAGLRKHDLLLAIDGAPFEDVSMQATLNRLRGPEGTQLDLQFKRGQALHSVRVVREEIAVKNVVSSVIDEDVFDWGYLKVHSFVEQNTCRDVGRELDKLLDEKVSGLILDVRDNAGGRIDQAVCVADLFLDANLVVLELRSISEKRRPHKMRTRFLKRTGLPLVTLVNAGTSSASEVLAGALRDYRRSLLLGERTFGKGTIQTTRPWDRSGSIMQFSTTARYYLPSGGSVQRVGLEPDLHVPQQPGSDSDRQLVLRLEDLYPTTPPSSAPGPLQSRAAPEQLSLACLTSEAGGGRNRREDSIDRFADYPLYRASELLSCML
jgi:carboxyl-terminal processing protease